MPLPTTYAEGQSVSVATVFDPELGENVSRLKVPVIPELCELMSEGSLWMGVDARKRNGALKTPALTVRRANNTPASSGSRASLLMHPCAVSGAVTRLSFQPMLTRIRFAVRQGKRIGPIVEVVWFWNEPNGVSRYEPVRAGISTSTPVRTITTSVAGRQPCRARYGPSFPARNLILAPSFTKERISSGT